MMLWIDTEGEPEAAETLAVPLLVPRLGAAAIRVPSRRTLPVAPAKISMRAAAYALTFTFLGHWGRVCGGPIYLLVAAASPSGFATFEGASRHGKEFYYLL